MDVSGYDNATNPEYDVVLQTPDATAPANNFGPNPINTVTSAADLQTIDGVQTFSGLSIGATTDTSTNWFSFNLVSGLTGLQGQSVSISYDDTQGNLTLTLYNQSILTNPNATPLGSSSVIADEQAVSLAGLSAAGGPYYIEVTGQPNPNYTLTINAPQSLQPDWAESHLGMQDGAWVMLADNNSQANAYDLRDLSSEIVLSGLSIDKPGVNHYFQFTTLSNGVPGQYIELDTNSNAGGLVMQVLDAGGHVVSINGSALATTNPIDSEQLSLDGLITGTYWLEISGATAAVTNPAYALTFLPPQTPTPDYAEPNNVASQAYDLGNASAAPTTRSGGLNAFYDIPGGFDGGSFIQATVPTQAYQFLSSPTPTQQQQSPPGLSAEYYSQYANLASDVQQGLNTSESFYDQDNQELAAEQNAAQAQQEQEAAAEEPLIQELQAVPGSVVQGTATYSYLQQLNPLLGGALSPLFDGSATSPGYTAAPATYAPQYAQQPVYYAPQYAEQPVQFNYGSYLNSLNPQFGGLLSQNAAATGGTLQYGNGFSIGTLDISSGGLTQSTILPDLSLTTGALSDWFKFTITQDGQAGQFASVTFDQNQSHLQIALYSSGDTTDPIEEGVAQGAVQARTTATSTRLTSRAWRPGRTTSRSRAIIRSRIMTSKSTRPSPRRLRRRRPTGHSRTAKRPRMTCSRSREFRRTRVCRSTCPTPRTRRVFRTFPIGSNFKRPPRARTEIMSRSTSTTTPVTSIWRSTTPIPPRPLPSKCRRRPTTARKCCSGAICPPTSTTSGSTATKAPATTTMR